MADSFMQGVQRGYGLSRILDDINRRSEERAVNGRIDEILAASNGGQQDLSTLDPKLYSDRIGMEAMGKVSQKLSQTGEFQAKIFNNGITRAKQLYGLAQGYMTDFTKATTDGDEPRARAIMGAMVNQFNIPYRFTPEGDGFRVTHITPEGDQDMGTMSLYDLYSKITDYVNDENTFVKGSAAYNMTNWETNMKYMADTTKWRIGVTKDGKQLAMVPQMFSVNGQLVGGFYVEGLGNRTLQQLADAGIRVGGVTGAGLAEQQAKAAARAAGGRRRSSSSAGAEEAGVTTDKNGGVSIPTKQMQKDVSDIVKYMDGGKGEYATSMVTPEKITERVYRGCGGDRDKTRLVMDSLRREFEKAVENDERYASASPVQRGNMFAAFVNAKIEKAKQAKAGGGNAKTGGQEKQGAGTEQPKAKEPTNPNAKNVTKAANGEKTGKGNEGPGLMQQAWNWFTNSNPNPDDEEEDNTITVQ